MEQLIQRHNSMVARTPVQFRRYMYNKIDWSNRMIGLTGPRGVGKTTLVLQRIKQQLQGEKVLYVNMEDFYLLHTALSTLPDNCRNVATNICLQTRYTAIPIGRRN